jgi:ADP-heptose:LPS heptosyltransferase
LVLFEQALVRDPDNRDLKWDRALALLQTGDYAKGLPAYEARWGLPRARPRKLPMPLWNGAPLNGRNIFLTDEQGFGDVLQFARFIPEVKRRGANKVVLECQPELMRLLALAPGVDAVIPRERAIPACDVYAPLLSLPAIFGVTLESLPSDVPYLSAPEPARRLPDDKRIKLGLVWAGKAKPRDRSIPLTKLLPLLDDPRFAAVSLQIGPRAADLKTLGADAFVTDLGPTLFDFAESAATLKQLDLLVTIDTAIAHLAGALGVPTFLLLRYTSDWRWFDKGSTSPWYPSFTLYRQKRPNRWEEPLEELHDALKSFGDRRGK